MGKERNNGGRVRGGAVPLGPELDELVVARGAFGVELSEGVLVGELQRPVGELRCDPGPSLGVRGSQEDRVRVGVRNMEYSRERWRGVKQGGGGAKSRKVVLRRTRERVMTKCGERYSRTKMPPALTPRKGLPPRRSLQGITCNTENERRRRRREGKGREGKRAEEGGAL